jgi:hypothetical protein
MMSDAKLCFFCTLSVEIDDDILFCDLCGRDAHETCCAEAFDNIDLEAEIRCQSCSDALKNLVDQPSKSGKKIAQHVSANFCFYIFLVH